MSEPSIAKWAVATPGQVTALKGAPRLLPIIVVPGIMGTRLSENVYEDNDPTKSLIRQDLVWNPLGSTETNTFGPERLITLAIDKIRSMMGSEYASPGPMSFNANRLKSLLPLFPDILNGTLSTKGAGITDYNSLIPEYYGQLCHYLHNDLAVQLKPKNIAPEVFCAGYDWRQTNRASAETLAQVVRIALKACNATQAVIVAHSQGGIVTRAYSKILGHESQIKGVVLLGSPTLGAPKAYGMLKDGIAGAFALQYVALKSLSNDGVREFARHIPSIYQLCPSTAFGKAIPTWLHFAPALTGFETPVNFKGTPVPSKQFIDCGVSQRKLYEDNYTGVTSWRNKAVAMSLFDHYSRLAEELHNSLTDSSGNAYMHPNTYCIFSSKLPTAFSGNLITRKLEDNYVDTYLEISTQPVGDGTVPRISANPTRVSNAFRDVADLGNVEHGALSNNIDAIKLTAQYICNMV